MPISNVTPTEAVESSLFMITRPLLVVLTCNGGACKLETSYAGTYANRMVKVISYPTCQYLGFETSHNL